MQFCIDSMNLLSTMRFCTPLDGFVLSIPGGCCNVCNDVIYLPPPAFDAGMYFRIAAWKCAEKYLILPTLRIFTVTTEAFRKLATRKATFQPECRKTIGRILHKTFARMELKL